MDRHPGRNAKGVQGQPLVTVTQISVPALIVQQRTPAWRRQSCRIRL